MQNRRQFVAFLAAASGLTPLVAWLSGAIGAQSPALAARFAVQKTDGEWQRELTGEQYRVLREQATERPFTSVLNGEKRDGTFACAGCEQPLFSSHTKFDSGTGWPSFYEPLANAVGTSVDRSWLMVRTEAHCARCGGHLGHVFPDGPPPTGLRYCINGAALSFVRGSGVT